MFGQDPRNTDYRRFQRIGDLFYDRQRVGKADGTARDVRGEILEPLQPVDMRNVGMVECREDFGFALEAGQTIRIAGDRGGCRG